MSFRSAISSSLSSLDRSRIEFSIAAHNIANADDKNYSKLIVNTAPSILGGFVAGVDIQSITTNIDESLQERLYVNIAQDSYNQAINDKFRDISDIFGSPVDISTIDKQVGALFSALDDFSRDPSSVPSKTFAVKEFNNLAESISRTALNLQNLRLGIDIGIGNAVTTINGLLESAFKTSKLIYSLPTGSIEKVDAKTNFFRLLEQISEYFDLYQYRDDAGHLKIFTKEGDCLIGDIQYCLKYNPQSGISNFIDDKPLNPLLLSAYAQDGSDIFMDKPIIISAPSSQIPTKYQTGKIGAYLALRDVHIPQALDQLDNLAKNVKDSFNNIHNNGNGFPPPNTLTSTNLMTHDQTLGFTGKTRISIVNNRGAPIDDIPSLTLDLSAIDTGDGPGSANLQGIIQEIQYHFGARLINDKSVELANLSDIKLVSLTKNIAPSSNLVLDLELDNFSKTNSNVKILSVVAQNALANNLLGSYNASNFIANAGGSSRTGASGPSITLNLPASIDYPITIDVQLEVNDGASNITTLRYVINNPSADNINGFLNERFSVDSKLNPSDPGTIRLPTLSAAVLEAKLVDETKINTIPIGSTSKGLLQLSTSNLEYHIAIDNLDSNNVGDLNKNLLPTNLNFSQHLGLNDLFVRTDDPERSRDLRNSALYLGIRQDIKDNVNNLSHAKLTELINHASPSQITYQYQTSEADNTIALEMLSLSKENIFFGSSGGLAAHETTIASYTASMISFNANMAYSVSLSASQSQMMREALFERVQSARGVNVNEEMTNMIIFQQSFAASAKALQNVNELMNVLINIL